MEDGEAVAPAAGSAKIAAHSKGQRGWPWKTAPTKPRPIAQQRLNTSGLAEISQSRLVVFGLNAKVRFTRTADR